MDGGVFPPAGEAAPVAWTAKPSVREAAAGRTDLDLLALRFFFSACENDEEISQPMQPNTEGRGSEFARGLASARVGRSILGPNSRDEYLDHPNGGIRASPMPIMKSRLQCLHPNEV